MIFKINPHHQTTPSLKILVVPHHSQRSPTCSTAIQNSLPPPTDTSLLNFAHFLQECQVRNDSQLSSHWFHLCTFLSSAHTASQVHMRSAPLKYRHLGFQLQRVSSLQGACEFLEEGIFISIASVLSLNLTQYRELVE